VVGEDTNQEYGLLIFKFLFFMDTQLIGQATEEQIAQWKAQHKSVFALEVEGHVAYLRKLNRQEYTAFQRIGEKDPLKANEFILENCWLGGSDAIKKDDDLFFPACKQLVGLFDYANADLKKI
jgi:hypothetical protein